MPVPKALVKLLEELKQQVDRNRKGVLELGKRQLLWAAMGQRTIDKKGLAIFGVGHRRRTALAMECVKWVMPQWSRRRPDDHMPMFLLNTAKDYLAGKVTERVASEWISRGWVHGDNLGCEYADRNDSDGQRLMLICHASVDAVKTALGDEEFDPDQIDAKATDGCRDVYELDASYRISLFVADHPNGKQAPGAVKRRREYWYWYLTEAAPRAYRTRLAGT